jgi:hypothetical protein
MTSRKTRKNAQIGRFSEDATPDFPPEKRQSTPGTPIAR